MTMQWWWWWQRRRQRLWWWWQWWWRWCGETGWLCGRRRRTVRIPRLHQPPDHPALAAVLSFGFLKISLGFLKISFRFLKISFLFLKMSVWFLKISFGFLKISFDFSKFLFDFSKNFIKLSEKYLWQDFVLSLFEYYPISVSSIHYDNYEIIYPISISFRPQHSA